MCIYIQESIYRRRKKEYSIYVYLFCPISLKKNDSEVTIKIFEL